MRLPNPSGGNLLVAAGEVPGITDRYGHTQSKSTAVTCLCEQNDTIVQLRDFSSDNMTCLCLRLALCVHRGSCLPTDQHPGRQKSFCVLNRKTKAKSDHESYCRHPGRFSKTFFYVWLCTRNQVAGRGQIMFLMYCGEIHIVRQCLISIDAEKASVLSDHKVRLQNSVITVLFGGATSRCRNTIKKSS